MSSKTRQLYEFGPYRLDPAERLLLRDGEPVPLTPKAFEVLVALVEGGGRLVGKEELMRRLWPGSFVEEANLTNSVYALRKALGGESEGRRYVETVPKHGYRLAAEVRSLKDAPHEVLIVEKHTLTHTVTEEELLPGGEPGAGPLEARARLAPAEPRRVGGVAPAVLPQPKPRMNLSAWMTALLVLIMGGASWLYFSRRASELPPHPMRVVPFTSFPGREDVSAFSPDGNQIAFVWGGEKDGNADVYVKSVGGERPLRLTSDPALDINPAWSPDGQRIAFVRISESEIPVSFAVIVVSALGNGPERKIFSFTPDAHWGGGSPRLDWSPDGKLIATSDEDVNRRRVGTILFSPETGEKHVLTTPPEGYWADFSPTFSPDGQTLAFVRMNSQVTADLCIVPVTGGEPKQLTFDNKLVHGLSWTSDGREVVFSSNRGGIDSLWKVPAAGGGPERLPVGADNAFYPSISRTGNRLAYSQGLGATSIHSIELSSSPARSHAATKLISSTRTDANPEFSPDGKRIAFVSDRSGSQEVWLCDSEGQDLVQLTSFGGGLVGPPRWSPDGRQVAFGARAAGASDVYVASVEGGPPRRVTTEPSGDGEPSWSRDGRWLYFASDRNGELQVWKVPSAGGEAVQVTERGGFVTSESADGKFIYYSKGAAAPGVWWAPVEGGEETLIFDAYDAGGWGQWALVDDGIYFIHTKGKGEYAVEFFSFATRRVTHVTALEVEDVNGFVSGLAVSPDRRQILYTQQDRVGRDIILVENFR